MTKRGRPSGWMIAQRGKPPMAPGLSKWELLTYKLGLDSEQVAIKELTENRSDRAKVLRTWIGKNRDSFFIPVKALEATGIRTRFDG